MRIGIIDLGTNSVRFDLHQLNGGQSRLLHREKLMIRLGQGVFLNRKLDPAAIQRTLQAFFSFSRTAKILAAEKMIAFGTSALREAEDASLLVRTIRQQTGIDIRIISGEEEAQLIAQGILTHVPPIKRQYGLVDIGGGSTEISICLKKKILHSASFPLGAARLQQIFLKNTPPLPEPGQTDPVLALRGFIKGTLLSRTIAEDWPRVPSLIGSSGTIRALQRILKKNANEGQIQRRNLGKLVKSMKTMKQSELLKVPGMDPKRVDIILAGAVLLEECMDALGAKEVFVTDYSLRDGILDHAIRIYSHKTAQVTPFRLEELRSKAKGLGYEEAHARQVETLAGILFDKTRPLHHLDPSWKAYLLAGAVLHDIGRVISPIDHEVHSHYIVKNAGFLGMQEWESEFIAQLCMNHHTRGFGKINLSFARNQTDSQAFVRLLALLRIADALDRKHSLPLSLARVQIKNRIVTLKLTKSGDPLDLEILRVEQKKALFEEVFKCQLITEVLP